MFKIILDIEIKEHKNIVAIIANILYLDSHSQYEFKGMFKDLLELIQLKENELTHFLFQEEILLKDISIQGQKYLNLLLEYIRQTTKSDIYKDKVTDLIISLIYDYSVKKNISNFVAHKIKKDANLFSMNDSESLEIKKELLSNSFKSIIEGKCLFDDVADLIFETFAFSSSDGDYGIQCLSKGVSDTIHIFVNGLTNDNKNSYDKWKEQSKSIIKNNDTLYGFYWASGKDIISHITEFPNFTDIKKSVKLLTFVRGVNLPLLVGSLVVQILSEWKYAKKNSIKYSQNLADFIKKQINHNPKLKINLYGHSLGANLIKHSVESLVDTKITIENLFFFGGASIIDENSCSNLQQSAKNIYNFYSNNDMILEFLYKGIEYKEPIGLKKIQSKGKNSNSLYNLNVTNKINGHTEYIENFNYLYNEANKYSQLYISKQNKIKLGKKMSIHTEAEKLKAKLYKEEKNPIKIAFFGQPGSGKSSMINKIIGSNQVETGARTDVTVEAQVIKWNGMILVDLPGYGTSKFPQNEYFNQFDILDYDLFLCIFSGKFHKADTDFFQEIRQKGKTALLVRNQSDMLWEDGKTTDELKQDITMDAQKHIQSKEKVYFTSCRKNEGFDELSESISKNMDASKKERWERSAKAYSLEALKKKKESCKKDIYTKAGVSAFNALNPVPGVDIAVDVGILIKLFSDIRNSYGLTDETLNSDHIMTKMSPIVNQVLKYGTKEGIFILLKQFAGRETVKTVSKYVPFVGQAIAALVGFGIIKLAGDKYLEDCHQIAEVILKEELKA